MRMTIRDREDGITHVVLAGRLDTPGVEDVEQEFSAALAERQRPTIVDMSEIEFLASRGIGLLFGSSKGLKKSGHDLVLLNPAGMVDETLKACHADKLMPIAYSLDDALSILGRIPRPPSSAPSPGEAPKSTSQPRGTESAAPSAQPGEWTTSITNDLSELEDLNAAIAEFLDAHAVPHRAAYAVNLAIDELVVNVIRYAYVDEDEHLIDIALAIDAEQIILRIADDGRPFDPRKGPSLDLHAEEREVGGLGLILVLDMVDVLKYQRVDERNLVEVRIHLIPDEEDPTED